MEIKIRKAKLSDIPSIEKLGRKTKEFVVSKKIRFYEREELEDWIKNPANNTFLIALKGNKVVGFLFSKIISPHWAMADNLVVSEKHRNNGIGNLLLNKYYQILQENKISYISGLVGIDYFPIRKFWKKMGFNEGKAFIWIEKFLNENVEPDKIQNSKTL